MKKILLTAFVSFTAGAICATSLIHYRDHENPHLASEILQKQKLKEVNKEAPQKGEKHFEKSEVLSNESNTEEISVRDKKIFLKNLVNEIVRGDFEPGPVTEGRKQQLLILSNRLGLTVDQLIQAELIWEKSGKNSRLWGMRELGILSDEEYDVQTQLLGDINFKEELKGILTEEQLELYQEKESNDRSERSTRIASIEMGIYQLNNSSRFSTEESNIIRSALIEGFNQNAKLNIPESIASLKIEQREKMILTHIYNNTSTEIFEKAYASIIEGKE